MPVGVDPDMRRRCGTAVEGPQPVMSSRADAREPAAASERGQNDRRRARDGVDALTRPNESAPSNSDSESGIRHSGSSKSRGSRDTAVRDDDIDG